MIDLHCHLLPGLDDGPASMPEALAMARAAFAAGTRKMVATPHIDDHWHPGAEQIATRAEALATRVKQEGIELEIVTGAEIALSRLVDFAPAELDRLRLGDGPYLLLECPVTSVAGDFDQLLLRVGKRGESIVLAHPERSPLFHQEPARLVRLVEEGMLCSITAGSIRGQFGEQVRRFTLEILDRGLAHNIASDAHDDRQRGPSLADALARAEPEIPGIVALEEWLTELAPAAILAGDPLPDRPALAR